jgi:hypothetical protein
VIHYTLIGIPEHYLQYKQGRRFWDEYRGEEISRTISLETQHNNKPLFKGPLHIDYKFFFKETDLRLIKKSSTIHSFNDVLLNDLMEYINNIAKNILYNPKDIVSMSAVKCEDELSHTDLFIKRLRKNRVNRSTVYTEMEQ